jgi:hypothetical protein
MSLHQLEHYLFRLKNDPALQAELAAQPRSHLNAQGLEPAVCEAILNKDVAALWQLGVHPLLLVPLSRFLGMTPAEYRAQLRPFAGSRTFRSSFEDKP